MEHSLQTHCGIIKTAPLRRAAPPHAHRRAAPPHARVAPRCIAAALFHDDHCRPYIRSPSRLPTKGPTNSVVIKDAEAASSFHLLFGK